VTSAVKSIFGGTDDSAQKAQSRANKQSAKLIAEKAEEARTDVLSLFPAFEQNIQAGAQGALDILGQAIPQQLGAFQAGNVGAQQALLTGLPQIQNAILGQPVDLSGLQAQQLPVDLSFAQQQLPQFQTAAQALQFGQATPQQQATIQGLSPEQLQQLAATNPQDLQNLIGAQQPNFNPLLGGLQSWPHLSN